MINFFNSAQAILALSGIAPAFAAPSADNHRDSAIEYSTVTGYFAQDDPTTNPSTFDYTASNFGLLNRTYDSPTEKTHSGTQWQKFAAQVHKLQHDASPHTEYKVLFMGRHGEGVHNAAETFYGTPAWNCYWAEVDGNSTAIWSDAHLTPSGIKQAQIAHDFWAKEIKEQHIPTPDSFYTSPLFRCLATANVTFSNLQLPHGASKFRPQIKELLREGISIHTCDRRSSKAYIARNFPKYKFETGFKEQDPLWSGVLAESSSAQDARSKRVLDDIFSRKETGSWVSMTSHSGEIASILRVLGHRTFSLNTGAIIPVLVKAEKAVPTPTSTVPWSASPHCTVPPVSSISGGACVCPSSATPVTMTLVGATPINTS